MKNLGSTQIELVIILGFILHLTTVYAQYNVFCKWRLQKSLSTKFHSS